MAAARLRGHRLHIGSPATFTCPDFLPYTDNTLTVSDPEGHTAMMTFTMSPCQAGMVP